MKLIIKLNKLVYLLAFRVELQDIKNTKISAVGLNLIAFGDGHFISCGGQPQPIQILLPIGPGNMRSWDRGKPSTSCPSPATLAKIASVPDCPWGNVGKDQPM